MRGSSLLVVGAVLGWCAAAHAASGVVRVDGQPAAGATVELWPADPYAWLECAHQATGDARLDQCGCPDQRASLKAQLAKAGGPQPLARLVTGADGRFTSRFDTGWILARSADGKRTGANWLTSAQPREVDLGTPALTTFTVGPLSGVDPSQLEVHAFEHPTGRPLALTHLPDGRWQMDAPFLFAGVDVLVTGPDAQGLGWVTPQQKTVDVFPLARREGEVTVGGTPADGITVTTTSHACPPSTKTDTAGHFVFEQAEAARGVIFAAHAGKLMAEKAAQPNETLRLELVEPSHLSLTVLADGKPLRGQHFALRRVEKGDTVALVTDAKGRVVQDVTEAGKFTAYFWGLSFYEEPERELTLANGKATVATLTLKHGAALTVRVKGAQSLGTNEVRVNVTPDPAVTKGLSPAARDALNYCHPAKTGPAEWKYDCLRPGWYDVVVSAPSGELRTRAKTGGEAKLELPPVAEVQGKTVDEAGKPVAGASVYCRGPKGANASATSGEGGTFTLHVVPGEWELSATGTGQPQLDRGKAKLTATAGATASVELVVRPPATIEGTVVTPEGKPIPNATVGGLASNLARVYGPSPAYQRLQALFVGGGSSRTTSDGLGHFKLVGSDELDVYGLTEEYENLEPLKAKAGSPVRLVLQRRCHVKGRVVDAKGAKLEGATVGSTRVAADGTFSLFATLNQEQALKVEAKDHVPTEVKLNPKGLELDLGTVVLAGGASLRGRVVDARTNAPIEQAGVNLSAPKMAKQFVYSAKDGTFAFATVPEGPLSLVVIAMGFIDGKQTVTGGQDVTVALQVLGRLEVVVKDPAGNPLQGRPVKIAGDTEHYTDAFGRAAFDRVTPGEVVVTVTPLHGGSKPVVQKVTLASGGAAHLDVTLDDPK